MVRKVCSVVLALVFCLSGVLPSCVQGQEMTLQADSLDYDPSRGTVEASGNVTLNRDGVVLVAPHGEGAVGGGEFHLWGDVKGSWKERGVELRAGDVRFLNGGSGRLEARGRARLVSDGDRIEAEMLSWELDSDSVYSASGDVRGNLGRRSFLAASFERQGDRIEVRDVTEMVDPELGGRLSARLIEGTLDGPDVETLEASGSVAMEVKRAGNGPVKVTGQKALYSKARGTLVISGEARAVQQDRIISADSIVLHVSSGRIEALGSPKLTFPLAGGGD